MNALCGLLVDCECFVYGCGVREALVKFLVVVQQVLKLEESLQTPFCAF